MSVIVEWDDETRSRLCCTFRDTCNLNDITTTLRETIIPMMDNVPHDVDLIVDVRYSDIVAEDALLHLKRFERAATKRGLHFGMMALVGMAHFYQTLRQLRGCPGEDLVEVQATSITEARSRMTHLRRMRQRG